MVYYGNTILNAPPPPPSFSGELEKKKTGRGGGGGGVQLDSGVEFHNATTFEQCRQPYTVKDDPRLTWMYSCINVWVLQSNLQWSQLSTSVYRIFIFLFEVLLLMSWKKHDVNPINDFVVQCKR